MEQSIKYTIKYLLNDGLFGYFVKSIVLNNRLDRICHELDSLGFEPNVFSRLSLCRSDNEKDKSLLPRRRKRYRRRKGLVKSRDDRYRDLTAEVGLGSMKASAPPTYRCRGRACKRAATYDSPSNEKIDRTERMESCWNREDSQDIFHSNDGNINFVTQILLSEEKLSNGGREKAQSSSSSRDRSKMLLAERETIKGSTLKLIIRKTRSLDCSCSSSLKPIRSCRLSLPCKANDVTREIFKADPGLHESCLIVMRRKFEMGIYNLCSCLNDVLQTFHTKNITDLRLILEIRPGYINFKLVGKKDHESRSCFFTDRVPICQSVHKRDVDRIVDDSIDGFNEVSSFNEFCDTFNNPVVFEETKNIDEGNWKRLSVPFFSPCSGTSMNEVGRTLDEKIDMEEEKETQLLLNLTLTGRSEKDENVSSSVAQINDGTFVLKKQNDDVLESDSPNLEINSKNKESVDDFIKCATLEERFDVDEEIKLNCTVECSCCSSCGTPIIFTKVDEEINIMENKKEILNLIKHFIDEIVEKIDPTNLTEDVCTPWSLKNEDISTLVKEENERRFSCDCSMSLDSLITRKTFCQEEINSDCDSRCSCRSNVSSSISSSSLDGKSNEDFSSSGDLKNKDKLRSPIPSRFEEIDASRTKDNSDIRLQDIFKNENRMMCSKHDEGKIVCNRKDFVSLSIQTSRTRTSSKFTSFPAIGKSKLIVLAKSWSEEKWTRELGEIRVKRDERRREKRSEILKPNEKGSSRKRLMPIATEDKSKCSFLPVDKRSICSCDISKRSSHRGRKRFKDESWTSRIKNYVSFRRSNFVSSSLCESFYTGRRSIGRLRNLVRSKLRRLMTSDGKNEIVRSKRKLSAYQKSDEIKRSHLACDINVKRIRDESSHNLFGKNTQRNFPISKDKKRIRDKVLTHNLLSCYDHDRCVKERRSMTYSFSKLDEKSLIREDNLTSTSSTSKRLVGRKVERGKTKKKLTDDGRTFEFVCDRSFWEERTDRSDTVVDYEKSICELGLDFRSKLEQYVALCKNIKCSLIGSTRGNGTRYK